MQRFNGQALNLQDVRVVDGSDPLGYADINAPGNTTTVTVRDVSGGTLSAVFSDNLGAPTSQTNPWTTDAEGSFHFYAANGRYKVIIDEGESTEKVIGDNLLFDFDEPYFTEDVGIGTTTPSATLEVQGTCKVKRTLVNGAGAAAIMEVASDAKTNNDAMLIRFFGHDSLDNEQEYSRITTKIINSTSGSESSELQFGNYLNGVRKTPVTIDINGAFGLGVTPTAKLDIDGGTKFKVYTVATLPTASTMNGQMVRVSDAAVGANALAISDNTNWKLVSAPATIVT